jgi:hypothetical protein
MDEPTIERIVSDDDRGAERVTVEHLGVDPAIEFGAAPRTVVIDDDGGDGDLDGGSGGDDGGEPGNRGGGDSDGEFQRNADGSVKRNADGSPRRKRRRRGSGTSFIGGSKTSSKGAVNLSGVEAVLLSLHEMGAAALKAPELRLESSEAEGMSKAIAEVARHYPTKIDPKTLAWANLVMACSIVYFPRFYLIRERIKAENAKPVRTPPVAPQSMGVTVTGAPSTAEAPPQTQNSGPVNASDVPFDIPGAHMAGLDG